MRRKKFVLMLLVGGLGLLCGEGNLVAADDGAAVHSDAAVLQAVFDDMLSKENKEAPAEWTADQARAVYVSKQVPERRSRVDEILQRSDKKKWEALTSAEVSAAKEAAEDLVARAVTGEKLPELRSASGRVKIFEEAGAATQPKSALPMSGERASRVYLPGYTTDGRYAVVRLGFPWSMHSGEVTYVLERTEGGWRVVLRDFVYYV